MGDMLVNPPGEAEAELHEIEAEAKGCELDVLAAEMANEAELEAMECDDENSDASSSSSSSSSSDSQS